MRKYSQKRVAVYTAIFGCYDKLKIPKCSSLTGEADFFCFTDNIEIKDNFYNVIYVEPRYRELVRNSRHYKVLGHPVLNQYDYNIWLDASYELTIDSIDDLIKSVIDSNVPIATFRHSVRACVYKEAITCIGYNKDYFFTIFCQMLKYFFLRMPKDFGLYETGILIKNMKSPALYQLTKLWHKEIMSGSRRDQLSLPYCIWKLKIEIGILNGSAFNNDYADYYSHTTRLYHHKRSIISSAKTFINLKFIIGRKMVLKTLDLIYSLSPSIK